MAANRALAISISADSSEYQRELKRALAETERFSAGIRKELGGASKNSQASFQNLGYQINDVAAQVAAGGNVIQAAGMQVGQFLQAFGPWGAIIGAAIAVGGGLAAALWDSKDAAKGAEKAQGDYKDAVELAQQVTETDEATLKRHNEERRIQAINAIKAADATDELTEAALRNRKAMYEKNISDAKANTGGLFGITPEESKGLITGIEADMAKVDPLLAEIVEKRKKHKEQIAALTAAPNSELGGGRGGRTKKEDRDDLAAYIETLKQAVSLEKLDGEQKAIKAALYRAEAAAKADDKTLTAAQIATVSALAAEEYNLAEAKKVNKDELQEYITGLQQELELQKLDGREKAVRTALIKAQSIALKENTVLTLEQVEAVTRLAGSAYDVAEQQRNQAKALKADVKEQNDMARQLGMSFQSAFEDAIVKGEGLRGTIQGLTEDIARMITRQAITNPLVNAVTPMIDGAIKSGGNWLTNYMKTDTKPLLSHLDGVRASGGPVNAGGTYLVGEHGPEIVKMGAPGSVTPTNRLGFGGGDSGGVTVEQHINISTGVSQTVRAEVTNMLPQIAAATKAAISNDQARKGRSL